MSDHRAQPLTTNPSRPNRRRALGLAAAVLVGTGLVGGTVAAADPVVPLRPEPTMTAAAPTSAPTSAPPSGDPFVRTELFFGTERPGPDVTDAQFQSFVRRVVTPRFPDGLTQYDALGQFRDSSGRIVKERSKVIILLYPERDARSSSERVEQIRDLYETAFDQESVLRADSLDLVSF